MGDDASADRAGTGADADATPTDRGASEEWEREYDAVVYDLDGTLARLAVDWDALADDAAAMFADAGVDADGVGLWDMFDLAAERGLTDELESLVAGREEAGARDSARLRAANGVGDGDAAVGVCSLNAESAVRVALERHGLDAEVEAVVGRDSVETRKPDPEPLLATLRELDVPPERAVFVGDSPGDRETAERAGVAFRYVNGGLSEE